MADNIWAGIGQARADDYRRYRKEEKESRRRSRRDQLLYGALVAPIGQAIGQGVTEFINQPFQAKYDDFLENEKAYKKRFNKDLKLRGRLENLEGSSISAAQKLYNDSGVDVQMQDQNARTYGADWRTKKEAVAEYEAKKKSYLGAFEKEYQELKERVAQGADLISMEEYRELLKKNNPHSRTAVGAGLRAIGNFIVSPFRGKPRPMDEVELEALKKSNSTVYEYIKGKSQEDFDKEYEDAFNLQLPDEDDRMTRLYGIAQTEHDRLVADFNKQKKIKRNIEKNQQAWANIKTEGVWADNESITDHDFKIWAMDKKLLTQNNAAGFSKNTPAWARAQEKYKDHKDYQSWNNNKNVEEIVKIKWSTDDKEKEVQQASLDYIEDILISGGNNINEENIRSVVQDIESMFEGEFDPDTSIPTDGILKKLSEKHMDVIISQYDMEDLMDIHLTSPDVGEDLGLLLAPMLAENKEAEDSGKDLPYTEADMARIQTRLQASASITTNMHLKQIMRDNPTTISDDQVTDLLPHLLRDVTSHMSITNGDVSSYAISDEMQEKIEAVKTGKLPKVTIDVEDEPPQAAIVMNLEEGKINEAISIYEKALNSGVMTDRNYIPEIDTISSAPADRSKRSFTIQKTGEYGIDISINQSVSTAVKGAVSLLGPVPATGAGTAIAGDVSGSNFERDFDINDFGKNDQKQIKNTLGFVAQRIKNIEDTFETEFGRKRSFKEMSESSSEYDEIKSLLNNINLPGFELGNVRTYDFIMQFLP